MGLISKEFNPRNKKSVAKLHAMLETLSGETIPSQERAGRKIGDATRAMLNAVAGVSLDEGDRLSPDAVEKLNALVIETRFAATDEVSNLAKSLANMKRRGLITADMPRANQIRRVDQLEDAIKEVQKRYRLSETGKVDAVTLDRVDSVMAAVDAKKPDPIRPIAKPSIAKLKLIRKRLSINKTGPGVADLQKNLAWLGYQIDSDEHKAARFGKSTRDAVRAFQLKSGLKVTDQFDAPTAKLMNSRLAKVAPEENTGTHRVRGSVRNALWKGVKKARVQVCRTGLGGKVEVLAERSTFDNGFFDIRYTPPVVRKENSNLRPVELLVQWVDDAGKTLDSTTFRSDRQVAWANFTQGDAPYRGLSKWQERKAAIDPLLTEAGVSAAELQISEDRDDFAFIAQETGVAAEDVLRYSLAHRIAKGAPGKVKTQIWFALIEQGLPPEVQAELFPETPADWAEHAPRLVEAMINGLTLLEPEVQRDALNAAAEANIISRSVAVDIDKAIEEATDARLHATLELPILVGDGRLGDLLEVAQLDEAQKLTVAAAVLTSHGVTKGLWQEMDRAGVAQEDIQRVRNVLDLGAIARNNMSAVKVMSALVFEDSVKFPDARSFAKLDNSDWVQLIEDRNIEIPANIPGDSAVEQLDVYVETLKQRAANIFPGTALVASLMRSDTHALEHVKEIAEFLDANPDFDLIKDRIDVADGDALTKNGVEEGKVIQRIHRMTSDPTLGTALLDSKLHSGTQIYMRGQAQVVHQLSKRGIAEPDAKAIFARAEQQYAGALAKLMTYRGNQFRDAPAVLPIYEYSDDELETIKSDIPDIETLFGAVDFCECEHCASVYSPAAYLTDMLRFLDEKPAVAGGKTVLGVLKDRRPDLANIKLDCANTNTPLPYIDLVNEILERVVPPADPDFTLQTTRPAEELRAIPEYVRAEAYQVLRGSDWPMRGHFNLWQSETRAFLHHLQVPRHQLMEDLQDRSNPVSLHPSDADIAAEYFAISREEAAFVAPATDAASAAVQDVFWGLHTSAATMSVFDFMTAANISYSALLDLLQCSWVNPDAGKSVIERPFDDCDVRRQTITGLTPGKYDRAHRFLRLWTRTGWQMWELDLLLRAPNIADGTLDGDALAALRNAAQVQDRFGLTATELAAFFGPIDTQIRDRVEGQTQEPLYHRLFQNLAVTRPLDPHFNLPLTAEPVDDHAATIQAALQINTEDLIALTPLTDGQTTPQTLAILFRYGKLAKDLRTPIKDLLTLQTVMGVSDPFASPRVLHGVLERYDHITDAGLSIGQLNYLLTFAPDAPQGLHVDTLSLQIDALRQARGALDAALDISNTLTRDDLDGQLARLPSLTENETRTTALDLIEGTWGGTDAERVTFITDHFSVFIPSGADPVGTLTTLNLFDGDQLTQPEETTIQDRFAYVAQHLRPYLTSAIVNDHIAGFIGQSADIAAVLQFDLTVAGISLAPHDIMVDPVLTVRDADGAFATQITETAFPALYTVHRLLHKIGMLLDHLELTAAQLAWFMDNGAVLDALDPADLPVTAAPATNLFQAWLALTRAVAFRDAFPAPEETSFVDFLNFLDDSDVQLVWDGFAALTQEPSARIEALGGVLGLTHEGGGNGTNYQSVENWHRLRVGLGHARLLGLEIAQMAAFIDRGNAAFDVPHALAARQAAKAKYSAEEWLAKVAPIEDTLREAKRDALVAHLIEMARRTEPETVLINGNDAPNPRRWADEADLFSYFLIDVAMSSCMMTSRIKQATLSVQLFVQRCRMNLEAREVKVPQDDPSLENSWNQWQWMANYRIWEANRKVFLYPENWIEPELRDDKTPFFVNLVNDLMQSEINADSAERAYAKYLDRLQDVANLSVVGLYHDYHSGRETMHVLARTQSRPYRHYHRTYDIEMNTWTAWAALDVEIDSEHAIPVIYNRKLHIFWLTFEQKPIKIVKNAPANASNTPTDNPEPMQMMEIRLAWTVKGHDGWSPGKQADRMLIHPWERPLSAYHLRPRYMSSDNSLWMDLYCSSTEDFNNNRFFQQHKGNKEYQTGTRFRETMRPWHSSSFVFNGDVRAVKMHGIRALYPVPNSDRTGYVMRYTSSYNYVSQNFGEAGRAIERMQRGERSPRLVQPAGMHYENNRLADNKILGKTPGHLNAMTTGLSTSMILSGADHPFEAVVPMQVPANRPFVFQDRKRAFFVKQEWVSFLADYQTRETVSRYVAQPLYHPYAALFVQELARDGVGGLLNRGIQTAPESFTPRNSFDFDTTYRPVSPHTSVEAAKKDIVDFSFDGAFSVYNWELFFHVPMYIANRLSKNQRFEEAQRWYHYIFDPTNIEDLPTPARYWITKPLHEQSTEDYRAQRIQNLIDRIEEFSDQVTAWKNDPFKPHLIARYRPAAYQRNVVMKYLDNLIAWADQLYRRDTLESVNNASLIYVLCGEIMGRRQIAVPGVERNPLTYSELSAGDNLDIFGNASVEVQAEGQSALPVRIVPATSGTEPLPRMDISYFCIPRNDKLMDYWSIIEDRLAKIRTCRNIDGVVRQLPLFAPPIDPALLVKAAAAGVDLSSALTALSVGSPIYRFQILVAIAERMALQVKQLGADLLRILESRDAEALAALRAGNEISVQDMLRASREQEIAEVDAEIESLDASWQAVEVRRVYYENVPETTDQETYASDRIWGANTPLSIAAGLNTFGALVSLIPSFNFGGSGVGGSPHVTASWGGGNMAGAASQGAAVAQAFVQQATMNAGEIEKTSRRSREHSSNQMQMANAAQQQEEINQRKLAAEIRRAVRENELSIQEKRWDNAKTEEEFLGTKYTDQELYDWMLGQASAVYFQAYQTAYDMAQRAERSFRHELGLNDSSYISFGYWDALRKGLQSAEKLLNDIHLMEAAFYEKNEREFELTKHISLAELSPAQLLQLKTTGECAIDIPEWLFDMDYPGHYKRRIKSVALSIPCVAGPYTGVHCTASLTASRIRTSTTVGSGYAEQGLSDSRFRHFVGTAQSIATSHGQNDDGLFELNLGDDRFLPFEGLGAIGTWTLKLPQADNRFDFATISDVVMHLRFVSRAGGGNFELAARNHLSEVLPDMGLALYSMRADFGDAWHRFLHAAPGTTERDIVVEFSDKHFPYAARAAANLDVTGIDVFVDGDHSGSYIFEYQLPDQLAFTQVTVAQDATLNNTHAAIHTLPGPANGRGTWKMRLRRDSDAAVADMPSDGARDIMIIVKFSTS